MYDFNNPHLSVYVARLGFPVIGRFYAVAWQDKQSALNYCVFATQFM